MTNPAETSLPDPLLAGLAALAAEGDPHATERLFRALLPRVRNLTRYLVRRDQDVDDLAQEALVKLFRGLRGYRGAGSFRSWADRVVSRSVFRSIEQRRAYASVLTDEDPDSAATDENTGPQSYLWRRALAASLDQLPWEQRQVIVLHSVVGLTIAEVAAEVDAPVETVRSRIRVGMGKLKTKFSRKLERRVG